MNPIRAAAVFAALAATVTPRLARAAACDSCCTANTSPGSCMNPQANSLCGTGAAGPNCENGCGPGGPINTFIGVMNQSTGADLTYACDAHDNCYNTCGMPRSTCDENLLQSLLGACELAWPSQFGFLAKTWCQVVAYKNYYAVRIGGAVGNAWESDQQQYCNCCDGCGSPPPSVDLSSDPANCGSCGNACGAGEACNSGQCGQCMAGQTMCSQMCVDTSSDPNNCGGCGMACSGGQTCSNGTCSCPAAQVCAGQCCGAGQCCALLANGSFGCGQQCGTECCDTARYTCCTNFAGVQSCGSNAGSGGCGACQFPCGNIPCCDTASSNTCCRLANYSYKCGAGGC